MFRELHRKNKQLPTQECLELLRGQTRGVLSVCGEDGYPYGMPMNYYYGEDGCIYFHTGRQLSHRTDALRKCDKVSFCVMDGGVREEGDWAYTVCSVIVFGRAQIIDDRETIVRIATALSRKFTQDEVYIQEEIDRFAAGTYLLKLTPEHVCGKRVREA